MKTEAWSVFEIHIEVGTASNACQPGYDPSYWPEVTTPGSGPASVGTRLHGGGGASTAASVTASTAASIAASAPGSITASISEPSLAGPSATASLAAASTGAADGAQMPSARQ